MIILCTLQERQEICIKNAHLYRFFLRQATDTNSEVLRQETENLNGHRFLQKELAAQNGAN